MKLKHTFSKFAYRSRIVFKGDGEADGVPRTSSGPRERGLASNVVVDGSSLRA